jgi:hypothetical protein
MSLARRRSPFVGGPASRVPLRAIYALSRASETSLDIASATFPARSGGGEGVVSCWRTHANVADGWTTKQPQTA